MDVFKKDPRDTIYREEPIADFGTAAAESFQLALSDTPFANFAQSLELSHLKDTGELVDASQLNAKYDLDLRENTTEAYAKKVYEYRKVRREREAKISEGFRDNPLLGAVAAFGTSFIAEGVDPFNLGLNFLTGFTGSKVFSLAMHAKKPSGAVNAIRSTGKWLQQRPITRNMIDGVTGNLIADSFVIHGNELKQSDAKMEEILAMSVATGIGFPLVLGGMGKVLSRAEKRIMGPDEMVINRRDEVIRDLKETREDFDIKESKINQDIEATQKKIKEIDPEIQAKDTSKKLEELKDLLVRAKEASPEQAKDFKTEAEFKVKELEEEIKHYESKLDEYNEKLDKSETVEELNSNYEMGERIIDVKEHIKHLKEELSGEVDKFVNNKAELEEVKNLLFGDADFDFMTLRPEQMDTLLQSYRAEIQRGNKFDVDVALNALLKNDELPRLQKELKKLQKQEITPEIQDRVDFLNEKINDIETRTNSDIHKTSEPERLYTKNDPDDTFKEMEVDEMEEKLFQDMVEAKDEVSRNILDQIKEAQKATACRIGELNGQ